MVTVMHTYLLKEEYQLLEQEIMPEEGGRQADERSKGAIFKNCAPFTNSISEINNTQIDNAKDLHAIMPMYD